MKKEAKVIQLDAEHDIPTLIEQSRKAEKIRMLLEILVEHCGLDVKQLTKDSSNGSEFWNAVVRGFEEVVSKGVEAEKVLYDFTVREIKEQDSE